MPEKKEIKKRVILIEQQMSQAVDTKSQTRKTERALRIFRLGPLFRPQQGRPESRRWKAKGKFSGAGCPLPARSSCTEAKVGHQVGCEGTARLRCRAFQEVGTRSP